MGCCMVIAKTFYGTDARKGRREGFGTGGGGGGWGEGVGMTVVVRRKRH